jgi:signal transduction histidine kinase/HAMP domain-containing protein
MTARPQVETRRRRFNSLRWQVSTLLLLSTLTAVALTALTIMLATALGAWPTLSMMNEMTTINGAMDELQGQLVRLETAPTPQELKGFTTKLDLVEERVKAMGDPAADCRPELLNYRKEAGNWLKYVNAVRDEARAKAVRPLIDAHRRVQAALMYSVFGTRPEWLSWLLPTIPGGLAWILVMSALSMIRAYRMQGQLSKPLQALAEATDRIKGGDYMKEIPTVGGVSEVEALRDSVEAMRAQLATSIGKLDSRNAELSTILDNMNDGVLLAGARGRIMEHNPEVKQLWKVAGCKGLPPADGLLLADVFPQFPSDLLQGKEDATLEVVMDPDSEPPGIFEISTNPIENPPEIPGEATPGHVLVITDVTAAREVEKMKLHFLSMVTHELKTPLTSVLGYTKVMILGKGGDLSNKHKGYIGIIDAQASRLLSMIQDLLDMTRLEVGNLSIEWSPLRVVDVCTSIYTSHLAAAKINDISFGMVPGEITDEEILGDAMRLAQVLGNLIGNAFKFTPRGGEVTLNTRRHGDNILIEVKDTGRGIPQAAIPKLFEKFYQVERGDTRKAGGAGLGLFICKELVTQMGGRIEVTSTAGDGSRFTVYLPLYEPEKSEQGT